MQAYRTAREQGKIAPLKLEHAGLRTTQLEPMVAWYCAVLEADVSFRNDSIAFLRFDEHFHRLAIIVRPGTVERPVNSAGLDHLAFTYPDLQELASTYKRLKALGITPDRATDHGSSMSFYYLDPDKNFVELKVDTVAASKEQGAQVPSRAFAANPFGTAVDPKSICH